ncbi:probable protein ABIL5 isoform X3 [Andrographis paniculata]|uniref:probable protein ABIL5 isoform X3 n=1 Tax=Andrographis paniculata TaxID=175694 RepID=UPI0021E73A63|nr:probable protein ABIL5 isoform X3 [Andrographis paniculata]
MEEGSSKAFVDDDAVKFRKSLKELRVLSSQLYHIADYCETAFGRSRNKRLIVEGAKKYASEAVVTVVDHLGSISASLELTISRSNPVPDAQRRIDSLNQRIWTCQDQFHKVALARFRWHAELSRFHHRYISLQIPAKMGMLSVARTICFEILKPRKITKCWCRCKTLGSRHCPGWRSPSSGFRRIPSRSRSRSTAGL